MARKQSYVGPNMNWAFQALHTSNPKGVMLRWILKSGKPSAPHFFKFYGSEQTAEEVIKRLEECNPGDHFFKAEEVR